MSAISPADGLLVLDTYDATIGYSLDCLRVLTGPVCERCWREGEVTPATIREHYDGWAAADWWCEPCHGGASESAYESMCADYYGGSGGLSDREREERGRDSGRGTW